jgi:ABC-type uncharacterized transport system substrate-binding protein
MHTQPNTDNVTQLKKSKVTGRKDKQNQEAVIKLSEVHDKIDNLIALHKTASEASACLNEGIKKIAEKSGLLASVVRKYVIARAGENFEEEQRKVEQLNLIFTDGE